ncbi:hypothetical protein EDE12_101823 [Methylosinus sp. sav-2]|uniref:hypothetical protein n=1 Tax=Methylosinus sp. sav-2 TaxID=2485168 RepID=UPI000689EA95|nr:hypothetical protein [Methylosinus sp. sav-2]TDX67279.1 hypothetical protein EDE12_101823 [Methylosinus sp. sav-2]
MKGRIHLLDPDRPDEALEVDIITHDESVLSVGVPNTYVSFDLMRYDTSAPYRGVLGGRSFVFTPPPARRRSPAQPREAPTGVVAKKRTLQKI